MSEFNFDAYIADYNRNEDSVTAERWYALDILVEDGFRRMKGRQEVMDFLSVAHDGVEETLKPLLALRDGNRLLVEFEIELMPKRDLPHYPLGSLFMGEMVKMRFYASYHIRDGKIAKMSLAYWPLQVNV